MSVLCISLPHLLFYFIFSREACGSRQEGLPAKKLPPQKAPATRRPASFSRNLSMDADSMRCTGESHPQGLFVPLIRGWPPSWKQKSEIDTRCPARLSDSADRPPPPPIALDLHPLVAFLVDYVEENGGGGAGAAELCTRLHHSLRLAFCWMLPRRTRVECVCRSHDMGDSACKGGFLCAAHSSSQTYFQTLYIKCKQFLSICRLL